MDKLPAPARFGPEYTPKMAAAIASCTAAITRLDARISVSPVASGWIRRAEWSGYARALGLQSVEIDEIEVFSWACGVHLPGWQRRSTHDDVFDRLATWEAAIGDPNRFAWREGLPTMIAEFSAAADHPPLIRALETIRQLARTDSSIDAWLGLPFAIRDQGLCNIPLPCLAGGAKAFRLKRSLIDDDWLAAIRSTRIAAQNGLAQLDRVERCYRQAAGTIAADYRPGALPKLLSASLTAPLLRPAMVASLLNMSLAGSSKLLERAASLGLLIEITERKSWRQFLVLDVAQSFGFADRKVGRPPKDVAPSLKSSEFGKLADRFDADMRARAEYPTA